MSWASWRNGYRKACELNAQFVDAMTQGRPLPETMPREDIVAMFRDVAAEIRKNRDTLAGYYHSAPPE
jgi:hypothetical protein